MLGFRDLGSSGGLWWVGGGEWWRSYGGLRWWDLIKVDDGFCG